MKKSIVVSIINGILFAELDSCHSIFDVRERKTGLLLSDRLEFHFMELGKVDGQKPVENLTEVEKLAAYLKYANDENRQEGLEQGRTEGEAAGRQEMKLELACAMKADGEPTDKIMKYTGLSAEEIEKI